MNTLTSLLKLVWERKCLRVPRKFHAKEKNCTDLVNALYRLAFARSADETWLAGNIARLQSGTPLEVLAEELVRSDEFEARHGSSQSVDIEYITALYRDGLDRRPESEGLASWLAEGKKGATRAQVLAAMARSDEAREKALACRSDSTHQPQGADGTMLVNSLYKTALGRLAEGTALAVNVARLHSGTPLEVLAEDLFRSEEFQARHGSGQSVDAEYVTALYRGGFGRRPDPEGLASWLAAGRNGATRAQVLAAMARSDEALEACLFGARRRKQWEARVSKTMLKPSELKFYSRRYPGTHISSKSDRVTIRLRPRPEGGIHAHWTTRGAKS
jgi:hypothetical protein